MTDPYNSAEGEWFSVDQLEPRAFVLQLEVDMIENARSAHRHGQAWNFDGEPIEVRWYHRAWFVVALVAVPVVVWWMAV